MSQLKVVALLFILQLSRVYGEPLDARHAHHRRQVLTPVPPLPSITFGMPVQSPPAYTVSYRPGSKPPISGAPPLPSSLSFPLRGTWPRLDAPPPIDSSEVKEWVKELEGVVIPPLSPTIKPSCALDPVAASEASARGWWTCGGHTRDTDIKICPNKLDWGLTFDDGPSPYTPYLLKKLKDANLTASFYVTGSRVVQRPDILADEYMSGHEIGVHTWSHSALTTLTNEQIVAELGWTRKAIKAAIGVTPTTMRPPLGDIDDRVRAISLAMGLVPVLWTATPDGGKFDSFDWRVAGGEVTGVQSFEVFRNIMTNGTNFPTGFITLQHDLLQIEVDLAVGHTLDAALNHVPKFSLQPVGQCAKINKTNLYRETNTNTTFPARKKIDVDGDGKIDSSAISIGIPKENTLIVVAAAVLVSFFL